MKESILSIAQWHKETFPDTDFLGQIVKWREEKDEWLNSRANHATGDIYELSDMFIVACGLTRFNLMDAMFCFGRIERELDKSNFATQDLERAVDEKMERNRARVWEKQDNGTYHHVKKDK